MFTVFIVSIPLFDPRRGGSEMRGRCHTRYRSNHTRYRPGGKYWRFPFQIYLCIMFNIRTDGTLKKGRLVLMYICYVHILTDLHSNKSFILLYCAPDMKRQQIMGGCSPPWEAREQIKRKATLGNKAMFWCCVIKWRQRARGSGTVRSPQYPYFIDPFSGFASWCFSGALLGLPGRSRLTICTNCPTSSLKLWSELFGEAGKKQTGFGVDLVLFKHGKEGAQIFSLIPWTPSLSTCFTLISFGAKLTRF